jgi:tetratricopeptide (TPR) repeat protein
MNRLAEAGEKFRRVIEIETDNADAHFFLAEIAERQHRFERSLELFRLVLGLEDDYPGARRRVARLLMRRGETGEARRLLRRDLRQLRECERSFTDEDLDELGQLLLDARLPRDGQRVYRVLTERRPESALAWHTLAVAQFNSGDRSAGVISTRRAIRLDPRHIPALHNLALAMIQERQWSRARSIVRRALDVDPDDVMLRRLALTLRVHRLVTFVAWAVRPFRERA